MVVLGGNVKLIFDVSRNQFDKEMSTSNVLYNSINS